MDPTDAPTPVVTVIGCGYVGLTTAAVLANCGLTVHALEINPKRLTAIRDGRSFFYEAGIDALIRAGLDSGRLMPSDDYQACIPDSNLVFSCVGTPDKDDGSANLSFVFDAAERAVGLMPANAIFIQKSTVPVGTGRRLQSAFEAAGNGLRYVSNPEFLREGTAIIDTLWPDRIVAGCDDRTAAEAVLSLYRRIESYRDELAGLSGLAELDVPASVAKPRYIATSLSSAELIKVSANAFLALKISFANSVAKLADQTEADVTEVMDAVGADSRIGRPFLDAGRGYGGGCFPKDVSSLIRSAGDFGVPMEIMRAAADVNESMPHYIIARAESAHGRTFKDAKVAVLGLAFKAGTSDVRRSPGITIANTLAEQGAQVRAYDPQAMDEAKEYGLEDAVAHCDSAAQALDRASVVFVATDWPEFRDLGIDGLAAAGASMVVDCMNCLDRTTKPDGVRYVGVGR